MKFQKAGNLKEFVCRDCLLFIDINELVEGCCPECNTDDSVFSNDLSEEESTKHLIVYLQSNLKTI